MASTEQLQTNILKLVDEKEKINTTGLLDPVDNSELDQQVILGVLNSLTSREMIKYTILEKEIWLLTEEGQLLAEQGSHEAKVFNAVPEEGISLTELSSKVDKNSLKVGQGKAFKNQWLKKEGDRIIRNVDSIEDKTQLDLLCILKEQNHSDKDTLKDLKKRKLCESKKILSYDVEKDAKFSLKVVKQATDLTVDMLQNDLWENLSFKQYNFDAAGLPPTGGHFHPLLKVREEFRKIFFELGFQEMPSNKFVESSFWNFDALFQPQQHPARDAHDTFFLKDPATSDKYPRDYMERVKKVHSVGGYGSFGYRYDWKEEEAQKLILRTHTTSISSNMLYHLAQEKEFQPRKWFSIERVFRNETVDATHLAEFHQVEGVIAGKNITLGDLIGFLNQFFQKMGVTELRFKPAYNPYTEPSLEIFSYHHGLGKWVEIGNSGMFRPELLLPMGFEPEVRVLGFGLSLERPTMIKYGIDNIRSLVGHKVELDMIQNNAICRLDK